MKLILNEKKILKDSLEKGYIDKDKPTNTIRLLTKHYFSIDMNIDQVKYSINDFFSKNYPGYNSVKWQDIIEKIVKGIYKTKDYKLFDVEKVEVTNNELEIIKNINNIKLEKLAFVLLVYAKIYNKLNENDSNWVNAEHKHIFSDAKIAVKVKEQGEILHELFNIGLIETSKMVSCTNIKVNFIDKNSDVVITIIDFRVSSISFNQCKKC
jgi:hypothetical protein